MARKKPVNSELPNPRPPSAWLTPSTLVAGLSLLVSLLSFAISFRSSQISAKALQLSSEEFASSRLAIFIGKLNDKNDEIMLTPADSNIHLQKAIVYFPPQLTDSKWDVTPPKFGLPLIVLRYSLEALVETSIPRQPGFVKFVPEVGIPLIIDSTYIAKGEAFDDRSLYLLTSFVTVGDETPPNAQFKGLAFLERIGRDKDPHSTLQALWNQVTFTPTEK